MKNQIDALVYELYGLSEEEIGIVEGAVQKWQKQQKKNQLILSIIKNNSNLYKAYEDGFTPDDIKNGIIEMLAPYFLNKEQLKKLAVDFLIADTIELARISQLNIPFQAFEYSQKIHHESFDVDNVKCIEASAEWLPDIYEGLSVLWSQRHLELDKTNLEIDEFVHECLRNFGSILEGSMNPILRELLHQNRIARGKEVSKTIIEKLKFGNVIDELNSITSNKLIFAPKGIRLNQWRNIAYHHNAKVDGEEIICSYGKGNQLQTAKFSRNEFLDITKLIIDLFSGFNLANDLFNMDNLEKIRNNEFAKNIRIRPEMDVLNLVASLASQGFEIIEFINDINHVKLIIQDVTNVDPDNRRIHTIQFISVLWYYTGAEKITVDYLEKDGTLNLRTSALKRMFEKIEKEDLPSQNIVEYCELTDLKTNRIIQKMGLK